MIVWKRRERDSCPESISLVCLPPPYRVYPPRSKQGCPRPELCSVLCVCTTPCHYLAAFTGFTLVSIVAKTKLATLLFPFFLILCRTHSRTFSGIMFAQYLFSGDSQGEIWRDKCTFSYLYTYTFYFFR